MDVEVGFATPADDEGIRALIRRQPLPGRIQLTISREPDFSIGCAATGEDCRLVIARTANRGIVGVGCRSVRRVFFNGREQRIGYLSQLRVDDGYRGRWLISRGLALLGRTHRADPLPAYLVSIVDGNEEATGVLVRNRRRTFPALREVAAYYTLAIAIGRAKRPIRGPEHVAPASRADLRELAAFLCAEGARHQFSRVWTETALRDLQALGLLPADILLARRNSTLVGSLALWDQSGYKQTIVSGYSGWLRALRPVLPRIGRAIRVAYASLIAVAHDDLSVFSRLLREAYNRSREQKFDFLLVGLDARDPLLAIARSYRHFSYPSRLYAGSWPDGPSCEEPDERFTRIDVATL